MKKGLKIGLGIAAVVIVALGVGISQMMPKHLSVSDVDLTSIKDGQYQGECDNKSVKVKVKVLVKDHKIEQIDLLQHINGTGKPAEIIIDDVVEKQTLNVDAISSATYSSETILKAIENALEKGK